MDPMTLNFSPSSENMPHSLQAAPIDDVPVPFPVLESKNDFEIWEFELKLYLRVYELQDLFPSIFNPRNNPNYKDFTNPIEYKKFQNIKKKDPLIQILMFNAIPKQYRKILINCTCADETYLRIKSLFRCLS